MIGGKNSIKKGTIADFFCDSSADVADLEQFGRDHDLSMGSTCYCIDTATLYMMKSDYSWKKQ